MGEVVMRNDPGFNELQVIVERRGYGTQAWAWRLNTGVFDTASSPARFICAEDAYADGRKQLLAMRGTTPPVLSLVSALMGGSIENKGRPTLRRRRSRKQQSIPIGW